MRNDVLDIMKGIGIILVVLNHSFGLTETIGIASSIIYTFHMPLFFVIAGFLAYGKIVERPKWIENKALHLVIPFLVSNMIWFYATAMDPKGFFYESSLWNWIKLTVQLGDGNWFLWTLFTCFAVLVAIDWLWSNGGRWSSIMITIIVIFFTLGLPANIANWFGYRRLSWFFLFLFGGYVLARYKDKVYKMKWMFWLAGLIGFPLCLMLSGAFYPKPENFNYWFGDGYNASMLMLTYVQAFCGVALIYALSTQLAKIMRIKTALAYIGTLTLGIFIFSGMGENIFLWLYSFGWNNDLLGLVACFIISGLVGWLLTVLSKKFYITNGILLGDVPSLNRLVLRRK